MCYVLNMQNEAFVEGHRCTQRGEGAPNVPLENTLKDWSYKCNKRGQKWRPSHFQPHEATQKEIENSYASTACVELEISVNEKDLYMTNSLFILTFQFNAYFVTFQHRHSQ
jgi:hypothetical protein